MAVVFSQPAARKLRDMYRAWSGETEPGKRRKFVSVGGAGLRFGKATAAWSSGNTITLDPCDAAGTDNGAANITVYLYLPTTHTPVSVLIAQNDVLGYFPFTLSSTATGVLASVPLNSNANCPT